MKTKELIEQVEVMGFVEVNAKYTSLEYWVSIDKETL